MKMAVREINSTSKGDLYVLENDKQMNRGSVDCPGDRLRYRAALSEAGDAVSGCAVMVRVVSPSGAV